jgi:hypothetical protein
VLYALNVSRQCIGGNFAGAEPTQAVGFCRFSQRATRRSTQKIKDKILLLRDRVDTDQPFDLHAQPGFFFYLPYHGIPRSFIRFNSPARKVPDVAICPMTQEGPAFPIEYHRERAQGLHKT